MGSRSTGFFMPCAFLTCCAIIATLGFPRPVSTVTRLIRLLNALKFIAAGFSLSGFHRRSGIRLPLTGAGYTQPA